MNFQQLRSIRDAARYGIGPAEASNVAFIAQPGVSRQIRELEEELHVDIFVRHGKRLVGLTDAGKTLVQIVEKMMREVDLLRQAKREYFQERRGSLTLATTHTQARYALPHTVQGFRAAFPDVRIVLQQGSPEDIAEWVTSGNADIGIATEGLARFRDLVSFPCYEWHHVAVVPQGHPLLALATPLTLKDLATYPLITYGIGFTGRGHIDESFEKAGIRPDIVLTAMSSDVIQQYVSMELGVGLVASMAVEHARAAGLHTIAVSHLFAANVTQLAVRRGVYLRSYIYSFILQFVPHLSWSDIAQALQVDVLEIDGEAREQA